MDPTDRAERPRLLDRSYVLFAFLLASSAASFGARRPGQPELARAGGLPGPPPTRTDTVVDRFHGVEVHDPYRWLEDQNSPETRAWINAQNEYTESILRNLPGREPIRQRLAELMKVDSIGVPQERNGRYFYLKRAADQDLSVLYAIPEGGP